MAEMNSNLYQTIKALAPMLARAVKTGQFFKPACVLTEPDPDILCEYDVKIPMSEEFSVTANIFRSKKAEKDGEKLPVVMCAHPYDNHLIPALKKTPFGGPPQQYRSIPQAGKPQFSTLTSWESPDPNFWVPAGYAVVNMNLPGYSTSEGLPTVFSEHQAKCFYEAIEWTALQPWCTGKVGLNGVSFLAITQYHVAACQFYGGPPPSLCAISPWEGFTDMYHDFFMVGGVEELAFPVFWWNTELKPTLNCTVAEFVESEGCLPFEVVSHHPFYDDYWKEKAAKVDEITVPMLVCGSFSDKGIHPLGAFKAFMKAKSEHKWVYTHRTGKWDAYYSPEVQNLTKDFFDCFLKDDTSSGFLDTPRVRLEVRSTYGDIREVRYENEWPLARTQYTTLYLSPEPRALMPDRAVQPSEIAYSAVKGMAVFDYKFPEDTELSGYMKLRVWVEARPSTAGGDPPDDMVIFTAVDKLDRNEVPVRFFGSVGNKNDMITRGQVRVSRRELDPDDSTEWLPVLKQTSEKKLQPGEIVPVDMGFWPSSTFFAAGETMRLVVSSSEIAKSPPFKKSVQGNRGVHVLHLGGEYDSHLLAPHVPPKVE
jgi:putative CocE/NonD family hydrolase